MRIRRIAHLSPIVEFYAIPVGIPHVYGSAIPRRDDWSLIGTLGLILARALHLATPTVKAQLRVLYRHLGARNRAHAVARAVLWGLLD
jgi:hypothetical protein